MSETLLLIIYVLLALFILTLIVLCIKLMFTLKEVNELLASIKKKMVVVDKIFDVVDFATDKMSLATEVIIGLLTSAKGKLFSKSKRDDKEEIDHE